MMGDAPGMDLGGIALGRAPKAGLAAMRQAGRGKRCLRHRQAGASAFGDRGAFHLRDLRQHRDDQGADAWRDPAEATDLDDDPLLQQQTHRGLDIQCVAAQPVDGEHVQRIAAAHISE